MYSEKEYTMSVKEQQESLLRHDDYTDDSSSEDLNWSVERAAKVGSGHSNFIQRTIRRSQHIWRRATSQSKQDHGLFWQRHTKLIAVAICSYLLCFLLDRTILKPGMAVSPTSPTSNVVSLASIAENEYDSYFVKPEGVKVIGLMFFGRPMFVNILDCYLRRNLAVNGGYLDEVHFIANTFHEEDLEYLDQLVEQVPQYIRIDQTGSWFKLWQYTAQLDPNTIVVKLDDDLVYMHDSAVPRVVHGLLEHPEAFAIAGHVVNNPHTQYWQYHTGALLPYLPEENDTTPVAVPTSWRASELPRYTGEPPAHFNWTDHKKPKYNMTRWLPLENTPSNLWKTPAINASWPNPRGGATMFRYDDGYIDSWQMSAQVHYSFLDHLERDDLEQNYGLGAPGSLWDQQFERYSINFVGVRAGEVRDRNMWPNDEIAISMRIGKKENEKFLVDTRALVVHYSFSTQHLLLQTDLLMRYLLYANEMVCAADNQKELVVSSMKRTSG